MKWTKELPTVEGVYLWRHSEPYKAYAVEITADGWCFSPRPDSDKEARERGGEWCRLVPAEEVEMAFREGGEAWANSCGLTTMGAGEWAWKTSRSKRVAEGKEEPATT